jgi:hypothetical protein
MVTVGITTPVVGGESGVVEEDTAPVLEVADDVDEVSMGGMVEVVSSVAGAEQEATSRHAATSRVRALTSDTLPRSDGYP